MRERINKKSSLIISILLIVCIIATSIIAMTMTEPYKKEASKSPSNNGATGQPLADNDRAVASSDLPLLDGQVPSGYTPWKSESDKTNWIGIANQDQMRLWLFNNHRATAATPEGAPYVSKNAYLTASFNYMSDSGTGNGHVAWDDGDKRHAINKERIFDGAGFTITLNAASDNKDHWMDAYWGGWSSFFVSVNYGVIRNVNFIKTGLIRLSDEAARDFRFGLIVASNQGTITNCNVKQEGNFALHYDGKYSHSRSGIVAGENTSTGVMSYITVEFTADSIFQVYSKNNWSFNSSSRVGGVIGHSDGTERNITVIGNAAGNPTFNDGAIVYTNLNLHARANDGAVAGAVCGSKSGGSITGVFLKGRLNASAGTSKGITAGRTDGSVQYGACYTTETGGTDALGTAWVVGNGGDGWKQVYTKVFLDEYDFNYQKPSDYYTNFGYVENVILTPKNMPTDSIVWSVNYNGANANDDPIFRSLAEGSVFTPHKFPKVRTELKVSFGKHYKITGYMENANGTSPKIYNGSPMPYNNASANLDDRVVYTSPDGVSFQASISYNYASMKVKIDDIENFLPTNADTYSITSVGEWVNTDNGVNKYGTNPDNVVGSITIARKEFTLNPNDISLTNYTKVYDGYDDLMDTEINRIPTGINADAIMLTPIMITYNNKNAGQNKDIVVQYSYSEHEDTNLNYTVTPNRGSVALTGRGIINTLGLNVSAADFELSGDNAYAKVYDKTNAYKGGIIGYPIYGATDTISLTNISAIYNSANVFDCNKFTVSFALPASASNFHLNNTTVDIAGSITPMDWTVSYADFSREDFYGDGNRTNITKIYDGNDIYDMGLLYANKTPLDEYLKLKKNSTTPSTFNGVNVGEYDVTYTFEMAPRTAGEMIPSETGDVLGDYRNYNLVNTSVSATGTITPKAITINEESLNIDNKNKTYDGNSNVIGNITSKDLVTGVVVNDVEETISLTIGNKTYTSKNVVVEGGNKIIVNVSNTNSNYIIVNLLGEEVAVINVVAGIMAADFTPSLDAFSINGVRIYNGLTDIKAGITANQQVTNINDENIILTVTTADYNSKNVAEANAIKVIFTLSNTNYALTVNEFDYTGDGNDIRITPKDIALTADNFNFNTTRQYDSTTNVEISSKDIPTNVGEEKLIVSVSANYDVANVLAGTIMLLFSTSDSNYNITNVDGKIEVSGVVTPKEITVTNGNFNVEKTKVYDGNNNAIITNYNIPGAGAETISLDEGYNAVFNAINAGANYDIVLTFAQSNNNYTLTNGSVVYIGEGSITPKSITITANDIDSYSNSKVYDQSTAYLGTFTQKVIRTNVGEEEMTLVFANPRYNDANVEQSSVVIVDISQDNTNYTINASLDLEASITPYAVAGGADETDRYTITIDKEYDGSAVAVTEIVAGQENFNGLGSDVFTFSVVANYDNALIGKDKDITIVFNASNPNYTFNTVSIIVKGKITAVQQIISLTIANFTYQASREYDGTDNLYNLVCDVKFNGESSVEIVSAKFDSKELGGGKTITFTITEAHEGYYQFDNYTFTASDGEIIRKKIALEETDFNSVNTKVYDGGTSVPYAVSPEIKSTGVNTDSFTISIGTATYNSKNVADANKITFTTAIADQSANDYYEIDGTFYLTANITRKDINLTSDNFTLANNGVITFYNNTAITVDSKDKDVNIQYIQGVAGERIELINLVANFTSVNAGTTTISISYSYENDNYIVNTNTVATGLINPHQITDAEIQLTYTNEKVYNANNAVEVLGGKVVVVLGNGGVYDRDILLKNLSATYDNVNVGENKIIKAYFQLDDESGNFVFVSKEVVDTVEYGIKSFADGKITVKNVPVVSEIITVDITKVYDGTVNYVGTAPSHGNIVGASGTDVITLVFGNIVYNSKDVNLANELTVNFSLPSNSNYALENDSVKVDATITAKTITVRDSNFSFANGKTKVYDNTDRVAITANIVDGINGEILTITINNAYFNSKNVTEANSIIVEIFNDDSNYIINNEVIISDGVAIISYKLGVNYFEFTYDTTKTYDGTLAIEGMLDGSIYFDLIGFEDSDLSIASFTGAYTNKDYGINKTITFTFEVNNANYELIANTKDYMNGVIDKAILTVGAEDFDLVKTKEYTADNTAEMATHKGTSGVNGETLELDVTDTKYVGNNFNVGNNETISITIAIKGDDSVGANYELASNIVNVTGCAIVTKEITVTIDNFTLDNNGSKVYDKNNIAKVTANGINGVASEILLLNVSGVYDDVNAGIGRKITINYALSDALVNGNYTLAIVEIAFNDCEITKAKLDVMFDGVRQSFRYNANPLANVSARTSSGLIGDDTTTYTIESLEEIIAGQKGKYTLTALPSNGNYFTESQGELILEFFKFVNGNYLIENLEDFLAIGTDTEYLALNFKQINDIDVNFGTLPGVKGDFSGKYDGDNKKITNAFLFNESLFHRISGSVKNLNLGNFVINAYNSELIIGGLANVIDSGATVENVNFVGSIYTATPDDLVGYVGGIAGKNNGTLKNVSVIINVEAFGNIIVGGLLGYNNGKVEGSENTVFAEIFAVGNTAKADNIVGQNEVGAEVNNVTYLMNGSVTVNNGIATFSDSDLGLGINFRNIADTYIKDVKVIDLLKTYKDRYKVLLSAVSSKVIVTNIRDYELIGQYNYLSVEFRANVQFFVNYDHVAFNGFRIGIIDLKGYTIDERADGMYELNR